MPRLDVKQKLAEFDRLPDDCIIDDRVAAALLGMSLDTLQRWNPVPKKQFSKRRVGRRAGDIRALIRGNAAA